MKHALEQAETVMDIKSTNVVVLTVFGFNGYSMNLEMGLMFCRKRCFGILDIRYNA